MIIKINGQEESIECQKMLFYMGYSWYSRGQTLQLYDSCLLFIDEKDKTISYSSTFNFCDVNKINNRDIIKKFNSDIKAIYQNNDYLCQRKIIDILSWRITSK